MDHSIHTYLRQANERATNEPLSTDVNSAGKTQAFYIEQSYTSGKFAAIVATLNSFAGSDHIAGIQPVLFASRTFDILSGDPKNPVYVRMDRQAASHVNMNPGSFTIGQTAAGKYLAGSDIIFDAIKELNATLEDNDLQELTPDQYWTVEQALWAIASENMVHAIIDANPDVKFRVFAGTSMDAGSILLVNEVAKIVARNKASINGEAPSAFSSDQAAALLDSTARFNSIYAAGNIIAPPHKGSGLRHIFACHPERGEKSHRLPNAGILIDVEDGMNFTPAGSGGRIIRTTANMPPPSTGVAAKTAFVGAAMINADRQINTDGAAIMRQSGPDRTAPQILLT